MNITKKVVPFNNLTFSIIAPRGFLSSEKYKHVPHVDVITGFYFFYNLVHSLNLRVRVCYEGGKWGRTRMYPNTIGLFTEIIKTNLEKSGIIPPFALYS